MMSWKKKFPSWNWGEICRSHHTTNMIDIFIYPPTVVKYCWCKKLCTTLLHVEMIYIIYNISELVQDLLLSTVPPPFLLGLDRLLQRGKGRWSLSPRWKLLGCGPLGALDPPCFFDGNDFSSMLEWEMLCSNILLFSLQSKPYILDWEKNRMNKVYKNLFAKDVMFYWMCDFLFGEGASCCVRSDDNCWKHDDISAVSSGSNIWQMCFKDQPWDNELMFDISCDVPLQA